MLTEPAAPRGGAHGFGRGIERASSSGRVISGYTEHSVTTTYLGVSTGTRLRHVQPTGKVEAVARDNRGGRSAWTGRGTPDFSDFEFATAESRLNERFGLG